MALTTFKELQRRVQQKIQNSSTSTSDTYNDVLVKIKVWINQVYERILRAYPFPENIRKYTLDIVAEQAEYALNRDVETVITVFDVTNGVPIEWSQLEDYVRIRASTFDQSGNVITGDPTTMFLIGKYRCCDETGSTAEKISVVSSSSSDSDPLLVQIRGLVSGVEVQEDLVITGTSAATSVNTYDATQKLAVHVGTNDGTTTSLTGVITISGVTSGNTISKIAPRTLATEYQWIQVSPQPTDSATQPDWYIWYRKKFVELENDSDMPILDCCNEIIQGAYAEALREDGQEDAANTADQKFTGMVDELWMSRQNTSEIEQMIPSSRDANLTLDFNRQIVIP
jgi:hypothetical protein